jgi:hypothetical protein
VEPDNLELFVASAEFSETLDLHTPEINVIDTTDMWTKEDNKSMLEQQKSGALVTLPADSEPKSLAELVELLDIPTHFDGTADHRRTDHCSTFGSEDLWPI